MPGGSSHGFPLCTREKKQVYLCRWPATQTRFTEEIRDTLSRAGVDQSRYGTHSFRIGAATTAAVKGIEDFRQMGEHGIVAVCVYSQEPADSHLKSPYLVTI